MATTKDSPLDARIHPIPAAESKSGKIQVYGILISLFFSSSHKTTDPTAIPTHSRPKEK
jgi:hypothetical protein